MSEFTNILDSFDPFEGLNSTDPVSKKSTEIQGDVSSIRKKATNPIDSSSKDNNKGIETILPENGALDKTLNSFKSDTLGQISDGYQQKTENFTLDDLEALIKVEDGGVTLDKDHVMDELSDVLGYTLGDSEAFKGEAGDELFKRFVQLTDPDGGALLDKNGNELSFKDGWRDGTTEGLIYSLAMRGYELYEEVKDSALEDAFDETQLYSVVQSGMVEAIQPIYTKIKPASKAQNMLINSIQYVVQNGDFDCLREILRILGSANYPLIKRNYPTLPKDFLGNYYINKKVYLHEHQALAEELHSTLSSVYGDDWYQIETSHGKAYNVLIGSNCSPDAVTLLSLIDDLGTLVALQHTFTEFPASEVFFEHFPDTPRISL